MREDDIGTGAAAVQVRPRTLIEMYGYGYRKAEEAGGRPGVAHLIYGFEDGSAFGEDSARYFSPPEDWSPADVMACERAVGRVLVVGCGAGRHALAVARAGHEVVGVDPSTEAVAVACRRGVDARVGGLGGLPAGLGTFDTFLLAGGGLHLLGVLENVPAALAELAEVANPGAWLIGTSPMLDVDSHPGIADAVPGQVRFRMRYRMRVEQGAEVTEWSDWGDGAIVTPKELAMVVAGTGWAVEEITDERSFDPHVDRYVVPTARMAGAAAVEGNGDTLATDTNSYLYLARLRLTARRTPA